MLKLSRALYPFLLAMALAPAAYATQDQFVDPHACELPHQKLLAECGNPEALSAVNKKDAHGLLEDYRRLSAERTETVAKANEEYRAYFSRKK